MKKITHLLKTLVLVGLLAAANRLNAQSPCSASFNYSLGPGGTVLMNSTSTTTSNTSSYTWSVIAQPYALLSTQTGLSASYTFSVNGIYYLMLQLTNSSPACVAYAQQTIAITNTTMPCNLAANFSTVPGTNGAVTFLTAQQEMWAPQLTSGTLVTTQPLQGLRRCIPILPMAFTWQP